MRSLTNILLFSALIFNISAASAQQVSEITPLGGEKWWGVFAGNSVGQPFDAPFEVNTAELDGGAFRVPLMISTAGRYLRGGEDFTLVFDSSRFKISSDGAPVGVLKGGRTLRQAYLTMHHRNFTETDKAPSPDLFTHMIYETESDLGFCQTAGDVIAYARRLLDEGFPAGIMVLADGWRGNPEYGFDSRAYPDPAGFVAQMHEMGFKVVLTVTPYLPAWGRGFAELHRDGMLVTDVDGSPLRLETPDGICAALDLTRPELVAGLKGTLAGLQSSTGVDGFRFDCSRLLEHIYGRTDYARRYLAALNETGADFALAEFMPGAPRFQSDYVTAVRSSKPDAEGYLLDVATAGLAAGPFTQVLPSFAALVRGSEEVAARYALIQTVMPVARVPYAPWKYASSAEEMKKAVLFRASLATYMARMHDEAAKTLEPIIRPMEYQFPKGGFADCTDQFMLGDKYLIAPVSDNSGKRMVRLPKGVWRNTEGRKYRGPLVMEARSGGIAIFELQ